MGAGLKTLALRRPDRCRSCGAVLAAGTTAGWDRTTRTVVCLACLSAEEARATPVEVGTAGASARREFERRHEKHRKAVRQAHPRLGGLILALSSDPQSTRAWDSGALGEEAVGRGLDGLAEKGVRVLHDRRIRGTRANIDHIATTFSGVHVIDAKRYQDRRPARRVEGGILRPRVEKLMVGSSDRTNLVDGVAGQVRRVRAALDAAGFGDVPVRGTLCFVEADWPMFGGQFTISGIAVRWPKALADDLLAPGPLDAARIEDVHRALALAFAVA